MKKQIYDRLIIYYFSGTGNAYNTALYISDEAKTSGIHVEIFNISNMERVDIPNENSLVGFISPTHGFHFPEITRKFIKQFPTSNNCSAFVVNTRAGTRIGNKTIVGLSGVLHYWSFFYLKRKGFKIVGLFPVDLPSNWISIHPAFRKSGTEIIYQNAEPKIKKFAKKIIEGGTNFRAVYDLIQDILVSPISVLYILFGKYFFAKSFIASSKCNNCNRCIDNCPIHAIKEIDGRKYWTLKCESCMQCMNDCPQKSIETAHGFMLLTFGATSLFLWYIINLLLTILPFDSWKWLQDRNIQFWMKSFLIIPFLFAGYRVMHWLLRFTIFERFFVFTSLTQYKFWGRYKSPKTQK